jgi:hypothetical protein
MVGATMGRAAPTRPADGPAKLSRILFQRRIVLAMIPLTLVVGVAVTISRSDASTVVPELLGVPVDPKVDTLRLRLETAGLVLDDVSVAPCPRFDIPGGSLERVPGTIIDQHPVAGERVAASTAVDVTICLPDRGSP